MTNHLIKFALSFLLIFNQFASAESNQLSEVRSLELQLYGILHGTSQTSQMRTEDDVQKAQVLIERYQVLKILEIQSLTEAIRHNPNSEALKTDLKIAFATLESLTRLAKAKVEVVQDKSAKGYIVQAALFAGLLGLTILFGAIGGGAVVVAIITGFLSAVVGAQSVLQSISEKRKSSLMKSRTQEVNEKVYADLQVVKNALDQQVRLHSAPQMP